MQLKIKIKPFTTKKVSRKLDSPCSNLVRGDVLSHTMGFNGCIGYTPIAGRRMAPEDDYLMVFHAEKHRPVIIRAPKDDKRKGITKGQKIVKEAGYWVYTYYKIPASLLKFFVVKQKTRHFEITSRG